MVTISFHFRPSSTSKSEGTLYVRIIYRRRARQWSLSCYVDSWEWDEKKQRVVLPRGNVVRTEYLRRVSEKLSYHTISLNAVIHELERSGRYYGVTEIQQAYLFHESEQSLRGYAGVLADEKDRNNRERTAYAYRAAANALVRFNGCDLMLTDLSPVLLKAFENNLKMNGRQLNTISFYMRLLKVICNRAHREGQMRRTAAELFADVFTSYEPTRKRALTTDDLSRLFAVDLPELMNQKLVSRLSYKALEGLYFAWRLFFFSFHACGMCFVDMACLRKESISNGLITYRRKKTGRLIEISLTPPLRSIINDFAAETKDSPYVFPLLVENDKPLRRQYESAERTYNRRLKRLALLAGLEGHLSSHIARHTWASIGKNKMFPLGVLSACLGHSSEKTTHIYLTSFNREILAEANRVITQEYIYLPTPNNEDFQRYMDDSID